jgi:hypothetical protein
MHGIRLVFTQRGIKLITKIEEKKVGNRYAVNTPPENSERHESCPKIKELQIP